MLTRSVFPPWRVDGARGRRDPFIIISDILLLATCGVRKTELMCKVGLSSEQAQKYLPLLSRSELLEESRGKRGILYRTTKKGKSFLEVFEEVADMLG
jgi:predicted transcriptional regulator